MSEHTPETICTRRKKIVASIREAQAKALLLAAAPDLLAAAEKYIASFNNSDTEMVSVQRFEKAIAKAKGKGV